MPIIPGNALESLGMPPYSVLFPNALTILSRVVCREKKKKTTNIDLNIPSAYLTHLQESVEVSEFSLNYFTSMKTSQTWIPLFKSLTAADIIEYLT